MTNLHGKPVPMKKMQIKIETKIGEEIGIIVPTNLLNAAGTASYYAFVLIYFQRRFDEESEEQKGAQQDNSSSQADKPAQDGDRENSSRGEYRNRQQSQHGRSFAHNNDRRWDSFQQPPAPGYYPGQQGGYRGGPGPAYGDFGLRGGYGGPGGGGMYSRRMGGGGNMYGGMDRGGWMGGNGMGMGMYPVNMNMVSSPYHTHTQIESM
jgi:hypothetical protein